ncbi:putative late blight resistance protein homolog R1B-23 [Camellia sinensis]|uniref:putative late blight resistance protein homolog R1B-23 n=1 Tax=Camellia sinensis TaxID=4442 RepID=UPI00103630AB|nr:putative late blight resistance protein homolog R1B-23 [Camellia sinensis]
MGENYFVSANRRKKLKKMFGGTIGENYSVLEILGERFEREMGEIYSVSEKQREIQREMGENYSVLEKLNHLMISKACNLTADQIDHLVSFKNRLRFLAAILKDLEEKQQQQQNYEAKNLPMQIYYVICKTRQLIRFFDVQVPGQRDCNNNGDSFFDILIGTNIMEEIKPIEAKVVQFYDQINQIQLLQDFNDGVYSSMSMENRTMVDEEITVGFDDEALTIKKLLAGGKKQLQMISIVGMPGLGKTTLATKLYNDPYITHYFHIRAWTHASQLPRKTDVLLDILRYVNVVFTDEIEDMTNEKLGEKLYKQLKGKRYLIVIDDIWDIGAWDDLKMYFPNDNNGSRVMFTSRLKELAMHASPDCHPHCLRFLTEEESWALLQRKVFQNESCPPELIEIGKQIMKKCGGLPLAIVIIAGLLAKNIKTQESWKQVAQSVSSYIVSDPNQYLDTLALSYNHLPRHLKPCFLYLGAFPENQKISVQRLIWLWIAEGFIQKIEQKSLEEVAEDYLMDLIQRSLLIVAQKRFDGRIKACRMHDLLRDLCLKKAREINFLQWIHNNNDASPSSSSNYETNNQCRLSILSYFGPRFDRILLQSYAPTVLQSLLCFRPEFQKIIGYNGNSFGDMCSFICWTFKLLRVLEICYNNAFFPRELTQLVNLRYLAINLKHSCELPPSISYLSNLETLIIISTEWRKVVLPCNVWKIPKLRHLYAKGGANYDVSLCSEEAVTNHNHPSILENLRTIANLNPCGHVQDLLARTPFLTKLEICGHLLSDSGNLMFFNLEFLRHLETLKLLNKFSYPTNFRAVKFPTNVKRLTLKYTKIKWEDISILGMLLPNLELLKLDVDAASGWQWATTAGGFPRLKFLKLKDLDVKQWITCSSHLPSLQHLSLDWCQDLEEVPSGLGDILALQLIEVNHCRFSVEESVRKIKEGQESMGHNWLKVRIRKNPWGL